MKQYAASLTIFQRSRTYQNLARKRVQMVADASKIKIVMKASEATAIKNDIPACFRYWKICDLYFQNAV